MEATESLSLNSVLLIRRKSGRLLAGEGQPGTTSTWRGDPREKCPPRLCSTGPLYPKVTPGSPWHALICYLQPGESKKIILRLGQFLLLLVARGRQEGEGTSVLGTILSQDKLSHGIRLAVVMLFQSQGEMSAGGFRPRGGARGKPMGAVASPLDLESADCMVRRQ